MYLILVIEDDDDYRELLDFGLSNIGYEVKVASRAKKAFELIQKYNFDFIICDILMPEMDGFEFLLEIQTMHLNSKIIMISGGGSMGSKLYLDNSTAAGCDAVLEKPFTTSKLDNIIQSLC